MPGALEAPDAILQGVDGGTLTGRGPDAGTPEGAHASGAARRRRNRLSPYHSHWRDAVLKLMTRRYEHASTVLTSNKGFEERGDIFGDDVMAAALIDRLVHHLSLRHHPRQQLSHAA